MIAVLLVALTSVAAAPSLPCVPAVSDKAALTTSALDDHRALRAALGEPMPNSPEMVMLHGKGGHLATQEYSIIVARHADGSWHGTAVGRSQIWVKDAPFEPMKRAEWTLDEAAGKALDRAIARRCPPTPPFRRDVTPPGPPPRGFIPEEIEVVKRGRPRVSFYAPDADGTIATLIRPPQQH